MAVVGTLGYMLSGRQVHDLPPLALGFVYGPALLGIALYASAPTLAHSGNTALFVPAFGIILSMYGGGFATVPAYLADVFGTQFVGAIHGRRATNLEKRPQRFVEILRGFNRSLDNAACLNLPARKPVRELFDGFYSVTHSRQLYDCRS